MYSFHFPSPPFFSSLPHSSICCSCSRVGVFLLVSVVNSLVIRYDRHPGLGEIPVEVNNLKRNSVLIKNGDYCKKQSKYLCQ